MNNSTSHNMVIHCDQNEDDYDELGDCDMDESLLQFFCTYTSRLTWVDLFHAPTPPLSSLFN